MPSAKLSSDNFWQNITKEDFQKLIQSPWDRLVELLLLIRRPQGIPDPGPELLGALDAVIAYKLASVISDNARRIEVENFAAQQVMKFVGH